MKMSFAINTNTILPIRTEANHKSEMTSQLLYGEYCSITDEKGYFVKIQNCIDNHVGWVLKEALFRITENEVERLKTQPQIKVCVPVADVFCLTDHTIWHLPMGSVITNYDPDSSKFEIADKTFQIHSSFISYLPDTNREGIIPTAMSLLNTPYVAGGKTMFGVDCSGFAQTVFAVNGYKLPRLSGQQSTEGETIDSLIDAQPGDLLFFTKEDVASHTAIYMGDHKIIHTAEYVKVREIDASGFDLNCGEYQRYCLSKIKRLSEQYV